MSLQSFSTYRLSGWGGELAALRDSITSLQEASRTALGTVVRVATLRQAGATSLVQGMLADLGNAASFPVRFLLEVG
jgi:hypothetical protein